jgi:hypothetical protein
MQISSINNQSFKGNIFVSNLSTKQKHAFDTIYPTLEKQVKSIKHLNLNIAGSLSKKIISVCTGEESKYIHMLTQVRGEAVPTANIVIESFEPKTILESAQDLINEHLISKSYKETVGSESKQSAITKISNKIKGLFGINK